MGEKILIFDTSIATENLGDLIILDSVNKYLQKLFPDGRFFNTATHESIGQTSYRLHKKSDFSFVAGTNLLSSNMNNYNQWKVNFYDAAFLKNIILMGVGWWQYQKGMNIYTKLLYRTLLHRKFQHSVRDSYTKAKLAQAGIVNCINTGCPTTWNLTPQHCSNIPAVKSAGVVCTLTDYNKNHHADEKLINLLGKHYEKVYFWPQGSGDLDYLKSFQNKVEIVAPSLKAFDALLEKSDSIDYVGTRLHAGIRAIQHGKRSFIIGVDNRAAEMAKDINLPFVARGNIDELEGMIGGQWGTSLTIDFDAIDTWRSQFTQ